MSENKNLTDVRIVRDAESGACLIVHDRSKNLDAWCANTEEEAEVLLKLITRLGIGNENIILTMNDIAVFSEEALSLSQSNHERIKKILKERRLKIRGLTDDE